MASRMTKRGSQDNVVTYEFICDTPADLQKISPEYITLGSVAVVISGDAGLEVYMANSQGQWINISGGATAEEES